MTEIYDPATGGFSLVGALGTARSRHAATKLANGMVLIMGRVNDSGRLASVEVYDPAPASGPRCPACVPAAWVTPPRFCPTGQSCFFGGDVGGTLATGGGSVERYDPAVVLGTIPGGRVRGGGDS